MKDATVILFDIGKSINLLPLEKLEEAKKAISLLIQMKVRDQQYSNLTATNYQKLLA